MKRLYLKILKCLLPVLFVSYLGGITFFTHSHIVRGITIVHSHPFNKKAEHKHTANEFQLIYLLSHVLTTGSLILPLSLAAYVLILHLLLCKPESRGHVSSFRGILSLRAPPF